MMDGIRRSWWQLPPTALRAKVSPVAMRAICCENWAGATALGMARHSSTGSGTKMVSLTRVIGQVQPTNLVCGSAGKPSNRAEMVHILKWLHGNLLKTEMAAAGGLTELNGG